MKKFKHITARSIEEATSALEEHGCKARIIAGGTDLLGEMKDCILPDADYPEVLVNIKRIAGLDYVRDGRRHGLHDRRAHPARRPGHDELVRAKYPALAEAAHRTASPHIREMGTVAGNICQNNRCWYYWVQDNLFDCLRKGGKACYALTGDARYHSIFGAARVAQTACSQACPNSIDIPTYLGKIRRGRHRRRRRRSCCGRTRCRPSPAGSAPTPARPTAPAASSTSRSPSARWSVSSATRSSKRPPTTTRRPAADHRQDGWPSSAPARPAFPPPTTCARPATR